jgi:hypothetical protein
VSLLCILHTTGSSGSIVQALKAIAATIPSQDVIDILQSLLNKLDTTSSHTTAVTSKASKSKSKAASKKATSKTNDSTGNYVNELADIILQATASDAVTAVTLIAEYIQLVTPQQQQQQEQSKKHSKTSKANSNSKCSNNSVSHTAAVSIDWLLANALFTALHTVSSQQLSAAVHNNTSSESNSNAMVVVTSADANNTNTAVLPVAVDYCIRALFDALTAIITAATATTTSTGTTAATVTATAAAENTRTLVTVLQSGVTTQTRNAGLLLLACMTEALPADTVHDSIHSILQLLSQGVAISDDTYSFQLTQQMIERVLPIIHNTISSSDSSSGIRVLDVVNTFVTSLLSVTGDNVTAQGKRSALVFTSLLTALSNSALASIGLSLLSHAALQAISSSSSSHSSSSIVSTQQQQQQQQLSANAIVNFAHAVCLKCSVSNQIKVLTDMIKTTHRLAFEVVNTSSSLALQQTKQVLSDEGSGSHLQFMTSTSSNSNSSSDSFMVLDMNTLLSSSTGIDTAKHARVLMHKQLQFIKEHLAAKALHLQIASDIAAAKRSANTKQHDTATVAAAAAAALQSQLQEDFLLLCEELLLLLRTLATCHITDSNSNSISSHTDTKHNWSAMQKLGHEVMLYYTHYTYYIDDLHYCIVYMYTIFVLCCYYCCVAVSETRRICPLHVAASVRLQGFHIHIGVEQ